MSTHPYPACPACRGTEFLSIPDVAVEMSRSVSVFGLPATKPVGMLVMNLIVCQKCGRTESFTKNAAALLSSIPGASIFTATPPPGAT